MHICVGRMSDCLMVSSAASLPSGGLVDGLTVADVLKFSSSPTYSVRVDDAVIIAGLHLAVLDVEAVLVSGHWGNVHGVLTGCNILRLVYEEPENTWSFLYKTACYDADWKVLLFSSGDRLEALLDGMLRRGWGYAVVDDGDNHRVIGVLDVARLFEKRGILEKVGDVRLGEIGSSPIISVSGEYSILDVLGMMLRRGVRRIYVEDLDKILRDQDAVRYLLSSGVINGLRGEPIKTLSKPVKEMLDYMHQPAYLEPEASIAEALKKLLNNDAHTIITEDRKQIITPWDMTLGIYSLHKKLI